MNPRRVTPVVAVCLAGLGALGAACDAPGSVPAAPAPRASGGPLRVHPGNPRYFTDSSGQPLYLAGSHTWYTIQGPDSDATKPAAFLDFIKARGHNFTRVWSYFYYLQITFDDLVNCPPTPWPYLRTGPGTAADGGLKFDLTKPNPAYLQGLRDFLQAAQDRGIYCSVMLFGSYNGMRSAPDFRNCTWHPGNNVNAATAGLSTGPDFFKMAPGVLALQEAHVRRVVDGLNGFDNVIWEIMNESMDAPGVAAWHDHLIRFIRSVEAGKPRQHLVGMTGGPDRAGGLTMSKSPADFVSADNGTPGDYKGGGPGTYAGKIVFNDTDHLWGTVYDEAVARAWVWKTFTRGSHPLFMEDRRPVTRAPVAGEDRIRYALGHTVAYSQRMNLARSVPHGELASTGYALADPGTEYLVYQPGAGAFTVDMTAGSYACEWFDPGAGKVRSAESVSVPGGAHSFTPPFAGDAVLYLHATEGRH